jgi:hypothetical protein
MTIARVLRMCTKLMKPDPAHFPGVDRSSYVVLGNDIR